MGRPLGPRGGRDPGGGGTGLPEGLSGGRVARERSGAVGAAASADAGAAPAGACAADAWAGDCAAGAAAGADAGAGVDGDAGGADGADWPGDEAGAGAGVDGGACVGDDTTGADWAAGAEVAAGAEAAAGAAGAAGGGVGRLLLIRRDERAGRSEVPGAVVPAPVPAAGAETGRAGAFLTGALLAAALLETEVSGRLAGASPEPPSPAAGGAVLAAFVALPAFLAVAGSSGWTGRRRPSASALRRTRSACASSIEDEWLLTPIPRERASSSPSLLVRPSSLASS